MKQKKELWLLLLGVLSLIGTALIFTRLPEQIPMHWGVHGQVDRYGARWEAFITAALPILIYGLMRLIPRLDPRRDSYARHRKAYSIVITVLILFLIALHWITVAISLGAAIDVQTMVCLGMAIMFAVIGNVLPQARHNYTFGIRTPWTLADEDIWRKTHRVGGFVFWGMAAVLAAVAFIHAPISFILCMAAIFGGTLFLIVYSYILYAHKRKGGEHHAS